MQRIFDFVQFTLGLGLIPYALAVVMPSWRWLLGVTVVIGGLLSSVWIEHYVISSDPNYNDGPGGAIGFVLFFIVTVAFAVGVGVRLLTLLLASRGIRPRSIVAISIAGILIVPAIFIGPSEWHNWQMRPPSEACLNATLRVRVSNAELGIAPIPAFMVFVGRTTDRDTYYFHDNRTKRAFCALGDNGRRPVKATGVRLDFYFSRYELPTPAICAAPVADWATAFCAAYAGGPRAKTDAMDFPDNVYIFSPDDAAMAEVGGSRSTYEESLHARPGSYVFITSEILTPDRQPLTFKCTESGSHYSCTTSYPWSGGAHLRYGFRSERHEVIAKGNRIDMETRKFLAGLGSQR